MNYKCFLRQQLCILVRGADGGRESVSFQIIMVAEMLCFRGGPRVCLLYGSAVALSLGLWFLSFTQQNY